MTSPLITNADGSKMGKTAKGAIWLDERKLSNFEFYQFWRNIDDQDVIRFLKLFTKVTEKAAIGASKFIGKKDKIGADKGAVDPMRRELNKINMDGTIVIGEGEMDPIPPVFGPRSFSYAFL